MGTIRNLSRTGALLGALGAVLLAPSPGAAAAAAPQRTWQLQTLDGSEGSKFPELAVSADGRALAGDNRGLAWLSRSGRPFGSPTPLLPAGQRCPGHISAPAITRSALVVGIACAADLAVVSEDGGTSYAPRSVFAPATDYLTMSSGPDGRIWSAWISLADASTLFVTHSDDVARTWSRPTPVNHDPRDLTKGCSASDPSLTGCGAAGDTPLSLTLYYTPVVVDPKHPRSAWVAWTATDARDFAAANVSLTGATRGSKLYIAHTADGGASWTSRQLVDLGSTGDPTGLTWGAQEIEIFQRTLAVDRRGNVTVLYASHLSSGEQVVLMARSENRGATWRTGIRLGAARSASNPVVLDAGARGIDVLLYESAAADAFADSASWDVAHLHCPRPPRCTHDVIATGVARGPILERGLGLGRDGAGRLTALYVQDTRDSRVFVVARRSDISGATPRNSTSRRLVSRP